MATKTAKRDWQIADKQKQASIKQAFAKVFPDKGKLDDAKAATIVQALDQDGEYWATLTNYMHAINRGVKLLKIAADMQGDSLSQRVTDALAIYSQPEGDVPSDLDAAFPRDDSDMPPPPEPDDYPDPPQPNPAPPPPRKPEPQATSSGSATDAPDARYPDGYVIVWRRFGGQDMPFYLTPHTDVAALLANVTALQAATEETPLQKAKQAEEAAQGDVLQEGQEYVYENIVMIDFTRSKGDEYVEFWGEGREYAELRMKGTDKVTGVLDALGLDRNHRNTLQGSFRLTVQLGKLQTYKKETDTKRVGDSKDPRYPNSFWQDFVSVERI